MPGFADTLRGNGLIIEEKKRIIEADKNGTHRVRIGDEFSEIAYKNFKERWVEQGIWNNKWNKFASGWWKHEESLDVESESEADSQVESSSFSFLPKQSQPKLRRPESGEEGRRIAERRFARECEREASRPYHQSIYQISKERERIQDANEEVLGIGFPDINSIAYENVKNTWTKREIWYGRWGVLPGMLWKHEQPFEEIARGEMGNDPVPANPLVNGNHDTGAPAIFFFGSPLVEVSVNSSQQGQQVTDAPVPSPTNPLVNGSHEAGEAPAIIFNRAILSQRGIFTRNPGEPNHLQASGALNSSSKKPSAKSENDDADRFPSAPNPPPLSSGKRVLHPTTAQASRPSKRNPSHRDGQPANASLAQSTNQKSQKLLEKERDLNGDSEYRKRYPLMTCHYLV